MSEQTTMTEENKKTIIAFVVGLLVGGLLVYVFAMPAIDTDSKMDDDKETSENMDGDEEDTSDTMDEEDTTSSNNVSTSDASDTTSAAGGSVSVEDQGASNVVYLENVTYPANAGWIGVRDYENGRLTNLLGVARWNKAEGLMPNTITLLRSTTAGKTYAVVFYTDNGDKQFNLATDAQMEGVVSTFVAR